MNEFWAALAGAVVGGVLTAVSAWWTTSAQWKREVHARRLERLDKAIVELTETVIDGDGDVVDGVQVLRITTDTIRRLHMVTAMARRDSPYLAALLNEIWWDADAKRWRKELPFREGQLFFRIVRIWLEDPEKLEGPKPPLESLRADS